MDDAYAIQQFDDQASARGMRHLSDDIALSMIPSEFPEFTIYSADYVGRELADMALDRSEAGEGDDEEFEGEVERLAGVLGYMQAYVDDGKRWSVSRVVANPGYGPLLYAVAAEQARAAGAILVPSDSLSASARRLWGKFERNPYVAIVEDGKSPLGIGIIGNGTLRIGQAIALDGKVQISAGGDYPRIVASARDWCEVEMDGLWDYQEDEDNVPIPG